MRNIGIVFGFELKSIMQKKSFLITTILLSFAIFAAILIPTFVSNRDADESEGSSSMSQNTDESVNEDTTPGLDERVGLMIEDSLLQEISTYTDAFVETRRFDTEDEMTKALQQEEIEYGLEISSLKDFMIFTDGQNTEMLYSIIEQNLVFANRIKNLEDAGLSGLQINQKYETIYNDEISGQTKDISVRENGNIMFGTAYTIFMYMIILLYGSTVSSSVTREKDNRTMEVLIANTKSDYLIIGKTLAAGLAGLLQILILIISLFSALKIADIPLSELSNIIALDIDSLTILVVIFFGITGYIFYLFIYAALGAMVSKMEDVNYAVMPVTFMFIAAYLITFMGITVPNNFIFRIGSFIPFTSVLAMPVRYLIYHVPVSELAISALIMLLSIAVFSYLAIRIYRLGSLNYGNRMKFFKTLRLIFKGEGK